MLLLFFAGAVTYAFSPHLGLKLLKQSAVFLGVLLVGPSLVTAAIQDIPLPVLLFLGLGASLTAYWYVTEHWSKSSRHASGSGASHAERKPLLPLDDGEDEE